METKMNILMVIGTLIMAVATAGICFFTKQTYKLSKNLQQKQDEQDQKFRDLLEALIIATILSGPTATGGFNDAKQKFLQQYRGTTKIFKDN
jgi:archaellum component FlaG (FlaF/FlaG flagellin family)